jgi:ribosomal protein L13E
MRAKSFSFCVSDHHKIHSLAEFFLDNPERCVYYPREFASARLSATLTARFPAPRRAALLRPGRRNIPRVVGFDIATPGKPLLCLGFALDQELAARAQKRGPGREPGASRKHPIKDGELKRSMNTWHKRDWRQFYELARRPWQRHRPPRPVYPSGFNRVLPAAGFSFSELDDAGVDLDLAESLGLPVDAGRIGAYGPNVTVLRDFVRSSRHPL